MRVTVVGQKPDGTVVKRTVSPVEFFEAWGEWAAFLWENARGRTLVIDGHKIRVMVHQ